MTADPSDEEVSLLSTRILGERILEKAPVLTQVHAIGSHCAVSQGDRTRLGPSALGVF